jgi:iron complex transport system substrate-binding protein
VIVALGSLVGARERALRLVEGYVARLHAAHERTAKRGHRPRVYFEEWDEPQVSCIRWVSELIELAGGRNVFEDRALAPGAKQRAVTAEELKAADPEIIFASWCGKPFDKSALLARPHLAGVAAVLSDRIHEVPSEIILQPGPACLSDGLDFLERVISASA